MQDVPTGGKRAPLPNKGSTYRPIKACYTKERKFELFCHNYRAAKYSMRKAAKGSGISEETVRRWRRQSPEFNQMLLETEAGLMGDVFAKGVELIEEGDGAMIRHYQNALDPRFKKIVKHDHSGRIDHVHGRVLEQMTPEEKMQQVRELLGEQAVRMLQAKTIEVTEAEEAEVVEVEGT